MRLFLAGVALGAISGGTTHWITDDTRLSLLVGGIAAVLTWFGWATLLILDD